MFALVCLEVDNKLHNSLELPQQDDDHFPMMMMMIIAAAAAVAMIFNHHILHLNRLSSLK